MLAVAVCVRGESYDMRLIVHAVPAPLVELRVKHAIQDHGKPPPVKSTVGFVMTPSVTTMPRGQGKITPRLNARTTEAEVLTGWVCTAVQVGLVLDNTAVSMVVSASETV